MIATKNKSKTKQKYLNSNISIYCSQKSNFKMSSCCTMEHLFTFFVPRIFVLLYSMSNFAITQDSSSSSKNKTVHIHWLTGYTTDMIWRQTAWPFLTRKTTLPEAYIYAQEPSAIRCPFLLSSVQLSTPVDQQTLIEAAHNSQTTIINFTTCSWVALHTSPVWTSMQTQLFHKHLTECKSI